MFSLKAFLARRFFQTSSQERSLHAMLYFCFITIALCSCALALVTSIMQGFERKTLEQFKGINPDLIIRSSTLPLDQQLVDRLQQNFGSQVDAIIPISYGYGMIENSLSGQKQRVVRLIALPALQVTHLFASSFIHTTVSPDQLLQKHGCLLGASLATELHLMPQQKITLWYLPGQEREQIDSSSKLVFDRIAISMQGYVKSGLEEFDEHTIICSQDLFEQLFTPSTFDIIGIKCSNRLLKEDIQKLLGTSYQVSSWQDLYPMIINVTKLEKYIAMVIVGLICMVASSTLSALMFMFITSKKREYALLSALGYSQQNIRNLFLYIGLLLSGTATVIGIVGAGGISYLLEYTQLIRIPDVYYVQYVPADFTVAIAVGTFLFMTLVSLLALLFPLRTLASQTMNTLLKFN